MEEQKTPVCYDRQIVNRLSRATGHLEAIRRMMEDGRSHTEVLDQIASVRAALLRVARLLLEEALADGLPELDEANEQAARERVREVLGRYLK